jgi:GTP pyrophosphokinase
MVTVAGLTAAQTGSTLATARDWLERSLPAFSAPGREAVAAALAYAQPLYAERRAPSGEDALAHALGSAAIVAELGLDADSVVAALLAPLASLEPGRIAELRERFGAAADLVEGVARMAQLGALVARAEAGPRSQPETGQLEALRKMLLAMAQDARVVLVKLASHTQDLRYLARDEGAPARVATARLAHDIFAPLANRLGVWRLKWEIEDLAFRILDPNTYRDIARQLDGRRVDRERYVEEVARRLREALEREGIAAEVSGRPKHIHSIYRKMLRKGGDIEALYDLRAVRVLVNEVKDCYAALGLVHALWTPIPKELDDYIARPKSNGYRSLHTAVIGPGGKAVEVQIRTHEMHLQAELGVAAHWRYKEGVARDRDLERRIAWLRQILAWKDELRDAGEVAEQFRAGLRDDSIYVLTPQGRVINLPAGATPVDFAYAVHTELGHRCRGARVDGVLVPLDTELANGQQVEIIAAKHGGPSRDWLNPALGYVRSALARAKIRQWFNRQNLETEAAEGRALIEKVLQRLGRTGLGLERLAQQLGYAKTEDLLVSVGRGELRPGRLEQAVRELDPRAAPATPAAPGPAAVPAAGSAPATGGVLVVGVDRLLTATAKCCMPLPPEPIVGFVTRGRGISVHRADCENLAALDVRRRVPAEWDPGAAASYPAEVAIEALERPGLLRDVVEVLARYRVGVAASRSASRDATARMRFTLRVGGLDELERVLGAIREVRGVLRAERARPRGREGKRSE